MTPTTTYRIRWDVDRMTLLANPWKGETPMKTESLWKCKPYFGFVSAKTKSEARAKFKRREGLKRLPPGVSVGRYSLLQ